MGSTRLRQGPQSGISWRSTLLGLVLGVALLAVAPSAAGAAVSVSGGVLTYNDVEQEPNNVLVSFDGTLYTVKDSVPITAGEGCTSVGMEATCSAPVSKIKVNSGPQDDVITIDASVPETVSTELYGREGNDLLVGGSGNDILNGFTGNDTLVGNAGSDTADYSSSPSGSHIVNADMAGGSVSTVGLGTDKFDPGQKPTVENIRGTAGDDTINGRDHIKNVIVCGGGKDFVYSDPSDVAAADCEDNDDSIAPTTKITSGPSGPTPQAAATFEFTASDKDPFDFLCWIENSPSSTESNPSPCTSPYISSTLPDGAYTFHVLATDKYGNSRGDLSQFTVDTNAPDTQVDSPGDVITTNQPSLTFSSNDPDVTTFFCRFDEGNFFQCSSPVIPNPPLSNGRHTFEVAAIDAAGNFDQTPASVTFTVNAPVPAPGAGNGTTTQAGSSNVIIGSLVLISGRSVKLVAGKLVPVSLTCAGKSVCSGTVKVATNKPVKTSRAAKKRKKAKRRVVRLGSKKFSIPGNKRKKVFVPLSKSKVKLLKRLRRVKVRATIREVDVKGHPRISTRTFMLRAR